MSETARLEARLRARLLQAMADADQAAFHYDQEGMKAMSLINAGKSLAFEEVMAWAVDEREGIAENARLHNDANDSERRKDPYKKCESFSDVCKTFMEVDPEMRKFFGGQDGK